MDYARDYSRAVRYSAASDHAGFQGRILDAVAERWKQKPMPKSEYDAFDPTHALVYADFLAEHDHPAELVFRGWADPERRRLLERMGMRGMFVGPAAQPKTDDGFTWSLGFGRKVRQNPTDPIVVSVNWERKDAEAGGHFGRVYAPITPAEATALADHIDRHYGVGHHGIADDLRDAASIRRR